MGIQNKNNNIRANYTTCIKIGTLFLMGSLVAFSLQHLYSSMSYAQDGVDFATKVHEYTPVTADSAKSTPIQTSGTILSTMNELKYSDFNRSSYKSEISKLTAMGILTKENAATFSEAKLLTGYDALNLLIRAAGRGPALDASLAQSSLGKKPNDLQLAKNDLLLKDARLNGIVLPQEELALGNTISKEQFGTFLARSQGITPTTGNLTGINSISDGSLVDKNLQTTIDALISSGVMLPNSKNLLNPKSSVNKGSAVQLLSKFIDANLATKGGISEFGVVIGKSSKVSNQFGDVVATGEVLIKKLDGSLVSLKTSSDTNRRLKSDAVVYKKGTLGNVAALATGDEIQFISKNNVVQYVEVLNSQTMISKLNQDALAKKTDSNYIYNFGTIVGKSVEMSGMRFRIRHYDGELVDFIVPKAGGTVYNDVLISKNGKVTGLEALNIGDKIEYLTKDNTSIVYAAVKNYAVQQVKGTVREIKPKSDTNEARLAVTDYKNQVKEYPIGSYARFLYGSVPATALELKIGQDINLSIANGYIIGATIIDTNEVPGYIPSHGKVRIGEVVALFTDGIGVNLTNGSQGNFTFDNNTEVRRNGQKISLKDIREGDRVKLSFDSISSNTAALVEVEGITRIAKQVYKGSLFDVDNSSSNLVLKDISYMKNTGWVKDDSYDKVVSIDSSTKFFLGQNSISLEQLYKQYRGSTLYMAVEDSFGADKAIQVTVKGGSELSAYDKVVKIDQTLSQMELKNKLNLTFNDGTIVIKDGRMIPRTNLQLGDSAAVISSASPGGQMAQVINILGGTRDYFSHMHFGTIETVGPNFFTLKYYSRSYDNKFSKLTELPVSREFTLNDESVITLLNADKTKTSLTYSDLFHGKYAYSETVDNASKGLIHQRYYTYFIEDDNGQVLAMNIRRKGPFLNLPIDEIVTKENEIEQKMSDVANGFLFSRGIYVEKDTTWNRLKMTASHDWSDLKQQWIANSKDTYTTYDSALIIKNNKVISPDELQSGDYLFVLRSSEEGVVIYVDNN